MLFPFAFLAHRDPNNYTWDFNNPTNSVHGWKATDEVTPATIQNSGLYIPAGSYRMVDMSGLTTILPGDNIEISFLVTTGGDTLDFYAKTPSGWVSLLVGSSESWAATTLPEDWTGKIRIGRVSVRYVDYFSIRKA